MMLIRSHDPDCDYCQGTGDLPNPCYGVCPEHCPAVIDCECVTWH